MKLIKELLIFFAMAMTNNANAALLCEIDLTTSPITCDNFLGSSHSDSDRVYNCSGGSSVTEFEVWGGCGPNPGIGGPSSGAHHWDIPTVQTPSGVQLASYAAGPYCYCQIKSINGSNVASSPQWVFLDDYGLVYYCVTGCAYVCANYAKHESGFRSALFQALQ